ncbi:MerR family transcriptional regulator [Massilia sp. erpn]|uniref:MerR family transcriptional regulator n=1 Tax=Massilia sp. erpn TaxID=2738142 RepID=UPI0021044791|nr:MerR family transcriptional regulator [Massilia sp. erpn]UTY59490.1 MerR family transcriptional regulator [Massilia sp. erpn]
MKIGELAERSGLAASAIRYYEQSGLLPKPERGINGYRHYDESTLKRLHVIQVAQNLGFSLDAVRVVMAKEGSEFQEDMMRNLDQRLGEIEQMMAALREQRDELVNVKQRLRAIWAEGDCLRGSDFV